LLTSLIVATSSRNAKRCASPAHLSPKIIVPLDGLDVIGHEDGPIDAVFRYLAWSLEARETGSSSFTSVPEGPSVDGLDISILENWARQAGWRMGMMAPEDRTIDM
jgi:hypothetical protein